MLYRLLLKLNNDIITINSKLGAHYVAIEFV